MRLDAIEFLIEICIAASVLNVVLIIILFFMIMGVSYKSSRQKDLISFIHKRAKISEKREEKMMEKATPKRMTAALGKGNK